jgi:hypothetical protein
LDAENMSNDSEEFLYDDNSLRNDDVNDVNDVNGNSDDESESEEENYFVEATPEISNLGEEGGKPFVELENVESDPIVQELKSENHRVEEVTGKGVIHLSNLDQETESKVTNGEEMNEIEIEDENQSELLKEDSNDSINKEPSEVPTDERLNKITKDNNDDNNEKDIEKEKEQEQENEAERLIGGFEN